MISDLLSNHRLFISSLFNDHLFFALLLTSCPLGPAGKYAATKGLSVCTDCPAGTYLTNGGASSQNSCIKCTPSLPKNFSFFLISWLEIDFRIPMSSVIIFSIYLFISLSRSFLAHHTFSLSFPCLSVFEYLAFLSDPEP